MTDHEVHVFDGDPERVAGVTVRELRRPCADEWEPGEYVAKVLPGVGAEPLELTHERVIRCRDCKHFVDAMGQTECERSSGEYFGVWPDGFCAWAEPNEES